jgi:hypothetical protein
MVRASQSRRSLGLVLALAGLLAPSGCTNTPIDVSSVSQGPAPLRLPSPKEGVECGYEESLTGGHIFEMYCGACHNARPLSERPFSNYQNVAQHMRVRANLTGAEYAKLMAFLRRWQDVPPPEQNEVSSPKQFFFSQPIPELRDKQPKTAPDLPGGPRLGFSDEASPAQPPPGNSPREAR